MTYAPWHPITCPIDLKHLGKLCEELGELQQILGRCIIQGMYEQCPERGLTNISWLEKEIADVQANIYLCINRFDLKIDVERIETKKNKLIEWHNMA